MKKTPISNVYMDMKSNFWLCAGSRQYIYNYFTGKSFQLVPGIQDNIVSITQAEGNKYYLASEHRLYEAQLVNEQLSSIKAINLDDVYLIDYIITTSLPNNW